jgi:MraZ protein
MFIGEYQHQLDTKGRVAVPVKFRAQLINGAIITRGIDRCLFLFSAKDWEMLAQKLAGLPIGKANSRSIVRHMLGGAMEVDIDTQGRILIPEYLRKYAGITKQAVIAGLYSRVEVWDVSLWESAKAKTEGASDEIAEQLGELGI